MLSFLGRHKYKIGTAIALLGAAGYGISLLKDGVMEEVQDLAEASIATFKKQLKKSQLAADVETSFDAFIRPYLPLLRKRLPRLNNDAALIAELKELRKAVAARARARQAPEAAGGPGAMEAAMADAEAKQRKWDLWQEVMVMRITRVVVAVYMVCALAVLLSVQHSMLCRAEKEQEENGGGGFTL